MLEAKGCEGMFVVNLRVVVVVVVRLLMITPLGKAGSAKRIKDIFGKLLRIVADNTKSGTEIAANFYTTLHPSNSVGSVCGLNSSNSWESFLNHLQPLSTKKKGISKNTSRRHGLSMDFPLRFVAPVPGTPGETPPV